MSALKEVWILFILLAFTNATEISNEVFTNQPWTSPFQVDCSRIFSGIAGLNCTEHNDDRHPIKLGYLTSIKNTSKGIYNRLPLVICLILVIDFALYSCIRLALVYLRRVK